jgi:outer membrane protein assembly factor BamA
MKNALLLISLFLICFKKASAQDYIIIDSISIDGNHKTNAEVILRELDISVNDTISLDVLAARISLNEKRLISIGLFTQADINISHWNVEESKGVLSVKLKENWFIYPYILFDLADRNFDVWRREFNYSLKRVNYGIALKHTNLTGMKDFLQVKIQTGFTQKYELRYQYPYLKNGWGYNGSFLYKSNKEVNYRTEANKPVFMRSEDERTLLKQWMISAGLYRRVNAFIFQQLQAEYNYIGTDPYVKETLNPFFLTEGKDKIRFFSADYFVRYDKRLYPLYPLGGFAGSFNLRKDGIPGLDDVNFTSLTIGIEQSWSLFRPLYFTSGVNMKTTLQGRKRMPYVLNKAVGYYPDVLTGHQLFVSDGTDFYVHNNALKVRLYEKNYTLNKLMPGQLRSMNTKIFMRMNFDLAYVYDPTHAEGNSYVNTWIYGYGPSIDIILYNFVTMSVTYGSTHDGRRGLYFVSNVNF